MSTYHYSQKIVQRSKGHAATKSAAYITGQKVHDEVRNRTFDYTNKEEVIEFGIEYPIKMPEELKDVSALASAIETSEKGEKAQLAVRGEMALPMENSVDENIELLKAHFQPWVDAGFPVIWGLHDKEGNPHAHYLIPQRKFRIEDDGTWKWAAKYHKEYKVKIDGVVQKEYFSPDRFKDMKEQGIEIEKVKGGKDGKAISRPVSDGFDSSKEALLADRERWENCYNESVEKHYAAIGQKNPEEKVSCKSYAARGIDKVPQIHEGPNPDPVIQAQNKLIRERNSLVDQLAAIAKRTAERMRLMAQPIMPDLTSPHAQAEIDRWRSRAMSALAKGKAKAENTPVGGILKAIEKVFDPMSEIKELQSASKQTITHGKGPYDPIR